MDNDYLISRYLVENIIQYNMCNLITSKYGVTVTC